MRSDAASRPGGWSALATRATIAAAALLLGALALETLVLGARARGAPARAAAGAPRWQTLPQPAALPEPTERGTLERDDVKLWFATFGEGPPVLLLHGGLGNSEHFGELVPRLAQAHRVIVMDSRGQGRSSRSARGVSYRLMADDAVALLDHLDVPQAAIVGWSDGGVIGLDVALRYPERVRRLFILGTNYDLRGVKSAGGARTFRDYFARCREEYARLAPDPAQLGATLKELRAMWKTQPTYRAAQLAKIRAPTMVALGEHDEIIRAEHAARLAKLLPHGRLLRLPGVSHFALWQAPELVADHVVSFLEERAPPDEPALPSRPSSARRR
ncbi:MAG: alpha/beta hydrolase [Kofleriaceae bacterium]